MSKYGCISVEKLNWAALDCTELHGTIPMVKWSRTAYGSRASHSCSLQTFNVLWYSAHEGNNAAAAAAYNILLRHIHSHAYVETEWKKTNKIIVYVVIFHFQVYRLRNVSKLVFQCLLIEFNALVIPCKASLSLSIYTYTSTCTHLGAYMDVLRALC